MCWILFTSFNAIEVGVVLIFQKANKKTFVFSQAIFQLFVLFWLVASYHCVVYSTLLMI